MLLGHQRRKNLRAREICVIRDGDEASLIPIPRTFRDFVTRSTMSSTQNIFQYPGCVSFPERDRTISL